MAYDPERVTARDARNMSPEELVDWAAEMSVNNSLRQSIVKLEFERRALIAAEQAAAYARASARFMLWSVVVLAASAAITAAATVFSAWLAS
jgi:hypothetical protein